MKVAFIVRPSLTPNMEMPRQHSKQQPAITYALSRASVTWVAVTFTPGLPVAKTARGRPIVTAVSRADMARRGTFTCPNGLDFIACVLTATHCASAIRNVCWWSAVGCFVHVWIHSTCATTY